MIEIARHSQQGPVKRKEISTAQGISRGYLENILISLKTSKLIRTTRGVSGGFTLDRAPSEINLLEIVTSLEGTLAPVDCLENRSACKKTNECTARKAWEKLYQAQIAVLKGMTLQDLLDMEITGNADDYAI